MQNINPYCTKEMLAQNHNTEVLALDTLLFLSTAYNYHNHLRVPGKTCGNRGGRYPIERSTFGHGSQLPGEVLFLFRSAMQSLKTIIRDTPTKYNHCKCSRNGPLKFMAVGHSCLVLARVLDLSYSARKNLLCNNRVLSIDNHIR